MREPEPVLVVDLFPLERQHLLQLLAQLREEEWHSPTVCAGWTVKDIALLHGDGERQTHNVLRAELTFFADGFTVEV